MSQYVRRVVLLLLAGSVGMTASARAAGTGSIRGTLEKPNLVRAVTAVNRDDNRKYAGQLDAKTGVFVIEGLPLGGVYDCVVDVDGARLEGVNLKVPRSDYQKEQPLSREDAEALKKTTLSLNQFEDKVEVLTIRGNIQHAAVLVNKLRTKGFINSQPGEVIWRLEVWHFEKPEETWVKVQDELFVVLYRERLQQAVFAKKSLTLDPALGGLRVSKEKPAVDVGKVALPGKEPGVQLRAKKAAKQRQEHGS
jgi:hypothetical protein